MGFKLLLLNQSDVSMDRQTVDSWPQKLRQIIPDIEVVLCHSVDEAMKSIENVDAAFGDIGPQLFDKAKHLRWIQCPQAGPKAGYYHQSLIDSKTVVTNGRDVFNDHISAHIMSFVLFFSRNLHHFVQHQLNQDWKWGTYDPVHLPDATAIIVGIGGIGGETARLCSEFGMTVIGVDPRQTEAPAGVTELHKPDALKVLLPRGDFVIVTVPETPQTQDLFKSDLFQLMKPSSFFINIGRGSTVVLDDLVNALNTGEISGAGLDVFQIEPLPKNHPLWTTPGALITPHVAGAGPYINERRTQLFLDNCQRFNDGRVLVNVVDKANWF